MSRPVGGQRHRAVRIQSVFLRGRDVVLAGGHHQVSAFEPGFGLERLAFVNGAVLAAVRAGLITHGAALTVEIVVPGNVDVVLAVGNCYSAGLNYRLAGELAAR